MNYFDQALTHEAQIKADFWDEWQTLNESGGETDEDFFEDFDIETERAIVRLHNELFDKIQAQIKNDWGKFDRLCPRHHPPPVFLDEFGCCVEPSKTLEQELFPGKKRLNHLSCLRFLSPDLSHRMSGPKSSKKVRR